MYFDKEVEQAIIDYNETDDQHIKNQLFRDKIYYAFDKLAEVLANTYKITLGDSLDDTKIVCVSHMVDKMHMFKPENGKAFSFFTVTCRNFLWQAQNKQYKQKITKSAIDPNSLSEQLYDSENQDELDSKIDFFYKFIEFLNTNIEQLFPKINDRKIVDAILHVIKRKDHIENLDKKALYIYVRNIVDTDGQQITKVVNMLKNIYANIYIKYQETGEISNAYIPNKRTKA